MPSTASSRVLAILGTARHGTALRCGTAPTAPARVQVPYSEHSSFAELQEFVHWFRPLEIIPSVGNDRGPKLERMLAALRRPPQQRVDGYFAAR